LNRDVLRVEVRGINPVVVQVEGELDLAGVSRLLSVLERLDGDVEVDCSGLKFVDAAGLGVLVRAHEARKKNGEQLVVVDPSPRMARLLHLTELDRVLSIQWNGEEH
jgi:anti-sigma B factor antagonist